MRNQARNFGWAALVLAALLASDVAVMTADSLPGWETRRLSAQETEVRSPTDEERMFTEARRALNREEFDLAAELFQALREKYPVTSGYVSGGTKLGRFVPDSYYWEAFGRYRQGDLAEAQLLLDLAGIYREAQYYRDGSTWRGGRLYDDVRSLRNRIRRQLAEQGDPGAAEEVLRDAERVLRVDSAAIREMGQQREARLQEAQARLEVEEERVERALEALAESMARYRTRVDSTDLLEVARQRNLESWRQAELYRSRLAQEWLSQWQLSDSLALRMDSAAAAQTRSLARALGEQAVLHAPDYFLNYRDLPQVRNLLPGEIAIHPECEDALTQQEALTSLLRLEVDVMPTVRETLNRDDDCSAHLRYLALNWLADEGTDEARELLMEVAGEHPDARTRRWALHGLYDYDAPEITELLLRVLRESGDAEVQEAAIYGLHRHPSETATEALVEFATDPDATPESMLRRRAAAVVAEHGAAASLPAVFNRFGSDDVRLEFLEIVGVRAHGGESEVTDWLLPVVADSDYTERVRAKALQAWLKQRSLDLEMYEEVYGSLETAELRDQLLFALFERSRSGAENRDAVVDKMIDLARKETDPEVRKRAIYWLGRTGSDRAAAFLMEILREGSERLPG